MLPTLNNNDGVGRRDTLQDDYDIENELKEKSNEVKRISRIRKEKENNVAEVLNGLKKATNNRALKYTKKAPILDDRGFPSIYRVRCLRQAQEPV